MRKRKHNCHEPSIAKRLRTTTTRDRHLMWNEFYSSKNFGIWIECTKCNKWRKNFDYSESHEVPCNWYCSMSISKNNVNGRCDDPEEDLSEEFLDYAPGSIVWARLDGYPWWPAMVDEDPDTEEYFWKDRGVVSYNVTFLDENVTRAWLPASSVCPFHRRPRRTFVRGMKHKKTELQNSLRKAEETATMAMGMKIADRLKKFSFANVYKGRWPRAHDYEEKDDLKDIPDMLLEELDDLESINSSVIDSEQWLIEDGESEANFSATEGSDHYETEIGDERSSSIVSKSPYQEPKVSKKIPSNFLQSKKSVLLNRTPASISEQHERKKNVVDMKSIVEPEVVLVIDDSNETRDESKISGTISNTSNKKTSQICHKIAVNAHDKNSADDDKKTTNKKKKKKILVQKTKEEFMEAFNRNDSSSDGHKKTETNLNNFMTETYGSESSSISGKMCDVQEKASKKKLGLKFQRNSNTSPVKKQKKSVAHNESQGNGIQITAVKKKLPKLQKVQEITSVMNANANPPELSVHPTTNPVCLSDREFDNSKNANKSLKKNDLTSHSTPDNIILSTPAQNIENNCGSPVPEGQIKLHKKSTSDVNKKQFKMKQTQNKNTPARPSNTFAPPKLMPQPTNVINKTLNCSDGSKTEVVGIDDGKTEAPKLNVVKKNTLVNDSIKEQVPALKTDTDAVEKKLKKATSKMEQTPKCKSNKKTLKLTSDLSGNHLPPASSLQPIDKNPGLKNKSKVLVKSKNKSDGKTSNFKNSNESPVPCQSKDKDFASQKKKMSADEKTNVSLKAKPVFKPFKKPLKDHPMDLPTATKRDNFQKMSPKNINEFAEISQKLSLCSTELSPVGTTVKKSESSPISMRNSKLDSIQEEDGNIDNDDNHAVNIENKIVDVENRAVDKLKNPVRLRAISSSIKSGCVKDIEVNADVDDEDFFCFSLSEDENE